MAVAISNTSLTFCINTFLVCGSIYLNFVEIIESFVVWCGIDSAEQLSVTVKIILALFYGRLKDGVRNRYMYSLQTSLKGV